MLCLSGLNYILIGCPWVMKSLMGNGFLSLIDYYSNPIHEMNNSIFNNDDFDPGYRWLCEERPQFYNVGNGLQFVVALLLHCLTLDEKMDLLG